MGRFIASLVAVLLCGCANTNIMDVGAQTIKVSTSAAEVCGPGGAQRVAAQAAAVETLRRGFDKYLIVGDRASNDVRVVGYTPIQAQTYGTGTVNTFGNTGYYSGQSSTFYTGGQPIVSGHHNQDFLVRMFRNNEPGADQAVDARNVLGPKWQEAVAKGPPKTC